MSSASPSSGTTLRNRKVAESEVVTGENAASGTPQPAQSHSHSHSHGGQPCNHSHSHDNGGNGKPNEFEAFMLTLSYPSVMLLFLIRVLGAIVVPVADCDEVYNYWEPLHYLLYGSGMQTWEYSPDFALRSYGYLRLMGLPSTWPIFFGLDKLIVFYVIRVGLAVVAGYAENFFVQSVAIRYGRAVGRLTCYSLLASYGICAAVSSALLPNSAAMICAMIIFGFWLRGHFGIALLLSGVTVVVVSPFVAVVFVPLAIHVVVVNGLPAAIAAGLKVVAFVLVPAAIIDWMYYGRLVVSAWNIAEYNALASEERGAELYGVEPWTYYAVNLALNFNLIALVGIPLYGLIAPFKLKASDCFVLGGGLLWLGLMGTRPHKEERFLYPIYPLIALYFAFSVQWTLETVEKVTGSKGLRKVLQVLAFVGLAGAATVSLSRGLGQILYFGGAGQAFGHLARVEIPEMFPRAQLLPFRAANDGAGSLSASAAQLAALESGAPQGINVCVGKEWYRFPSSFYFPTLQAKAEGEQAPRVRLQFVKSSFGGQLPQHFPEGPGSQMQYTAVSQPGFNDLNKEDPARYVDLQSDCHYLVDFDISEVHEGGVLVHGMSDDPDAQMQVALRNGPFTSIFETSFMNSGKTALPGRAFYVPGLDVHYDAYRVWRNEALFHD